MRWALAPAGTPKPIVDKLSAEFTRIVGSQEIRDYMTKQGIIAFSSTPEQLAALMKSLMTNISFWKSWLACLFCRACS